LALGTKKDSLQEVGVASSLCTRRKRLIERHIKREMKAWLGLAFVSF